MFCIQKERYEGTKLGKGTLMRRPGESFVEGVKMDLGPVKYVKMGRKSGQGRRNVYAKALRQEREKSVLQE